MMAQHKNNIAILFSVLIVLIILFFTLFFLIKKGVLTVKVNTPRPQLPNELSTPQPAPTFIPKPIGSGLITVNNSFGKDVIGPKMYQSLFDPITPALNATQTVTAKIRHTAPVTSVKAVITTDTKNHDLQFKLASGTDTDGVWTATWTIDDTYDKQYYVNFILKSSDNTTYEGGPTFRALPAK